MPITTQEDWTPVVGDKINRIGSDYSFEGTIVSVFRKTTGKVRYVMEDDRGMLFIMSRKNFEKLND